MKSNLSFEYFISKKTAKSIIQGKKVSKPIVRISIISIGLAVIVNLITIAVVNGFQKEVRKKISGFSPHIFIMNASDNNIYEGSAINANQNFIKTLSSNKNINSINGVAYKAVLFQSKKNKIHYKLSNGKDTSEISQQVSGAIMKGVDKNYNLNFYQENLVEGELPDYKNISSNKHILISKKLADKLLYKLRDTISVFFVKNIPVKRNFIVVGIYDTGLEEFDEKFVISKLSTVQELNDWGIKSFIELSDTILNGQIIVEANVQGGNGNYRYNWGKGYQRKSRFTHFPTKDTIFQLIASDYWNNIEGINEKNTIADTAYLKMTITGNRNSPCDFKLNKLGQIERKYLKNDGSKFSIQASEKKVIFETIKGKGSYQKYIGGFEIKVNEWEKLNTVLDNTSKIIDFIPTKYGEVLKTTSILDNENDIFVWLDFLDINVVIILTLMILIGIINMGSALLVLILIRSNFIGILKALGAKNWSIRKIFLMQATFLISRGLLWGNIIGLSLYFVQQKFKLFKLNPEVYYLNSVPLDLSFVEWIILNISILLICLISLIVPSIVITRIKPIKSIKFN